MMPTSSEFIALCRAQVALLTQGLGASLSVVYLTQELATETETQLVPVVAYPETAMDWQNLGRSPLALLTDATPRLLAEPTAARGEDSQLTVSGLNLVQSLFHQPTLPDRDLTDPASALTLQRRIVVPLIHENAVFGLLVTERSDRAWDEWEQAQIQKIAETLAIARLLDQRYQWLEQERRQQQLLQAQQHDVFDNLLHQFRNSLTALQTFGKLILKRLLPEDANRELAASLVRETTRLRELSEQLEAAVNATEPSVVEPLSLPAADWRPMEWQPDGGGDRLGLPATLPLLPSAGLQSGVGLTLEPCSVTDILEPLLASAATIAQAQALTLHTDLHPDLPLVWASPQALREVCNNLLENALKYTPTGGHVVVRTCLFSTLEDSETWLELSVSDTGPGIPAQDLPHIFERRFRGIQAQTAIPGSGLGLAIARVLVEQMHGEIAVLSPARSSDLTAIADTLPAAPLSGTTLVVRLAIANP